MATLFNRQWTRAELMNHIGDLSQVAGVKLSELSDGNERGVRTADVRTGSGLEFTILLDRGMDIGQASYKGMPLAWNSPTGFVHPMYYDERGVNWLRTFGGGLLMGCGLTSAGAPEVDDGEELGLHGRLSHLPARHVSVKETWDGDDCVFTVEGEMKQAKTFGENLRLTRRVTTGLGSNKIEICDTVENLGHSVSPLMVLYHMNLGFPLLDENTELVTEPHGVETRDAAAEPGLNDWMRFQKPTADYIEQVFYHDLLADGRGWAKVDVVNKPRNLSLTIRFKKDTLPNMVQWKMMGQGHYVLGIEPANCHVTGRSQERARGTLQHLQPGEKREFRIDVEVK